jgi:pimeloyl-ACP methyl ester carboxylesterase
VPDVAPTTRTVRAGGLDHRVVEWDGGGTTTVLFVHGYLDCGGSFDALARALPADLHCVAPDMRGHGLTGRAAESGYYHFVDYVRDLRDLVDALVRDRLVLVGHSMGGGVCSLFAGTWPEELHRLVLLEGLGPPRENLDDGPKRMRRWIEETRAVRGGRRPVKSFATLQEGAARLQKKDSFLPDARALDLARWLVREREDGAFEWLHDPMHRTRTPMIYRPEVWRPFLLATTCPVLTVTAGVTWYRWPDLPERRAALRDHRHLHIEEASHMLHHDAPEELAEAIGAFL